jgi:hypothetical protein
VTWKAGQFAGAICSEYFAEFYRQFEIGPKGAIALLNSAGIILARSPDNDLYAGRDLSQMPLLRKQDSQPNDGVYYFKSPLDGVQRLSFYKRSDRFPLMVVATMAQDDVLASWRGNAIIRMIIVLVLTPLIAISGFFVVRQLSRGRRLVSALAAKEADFRLLAEKSSDMVTRIGPALPIWPPGMAGENSSCYCRTRISWAANRSLRKFERSFDG